jgi:hypothetical protein
MPKPRGCLVWGRNNMFTANPFTHNIEHTAITVERYFAKGDLLENYAMHVCLSELQMEIPYRTTTPVAACTYCLSPHARVGDESMCTRRGCPKVPHCARITVHFFCGQMGSTLETDYFLRHQLSLTVSDQSASKTMQVSPMIDSTACLPHTPLF